MLTDTDRFHPSFAPWRLCVRSLFALTLVASAAVCQAQQTNGLGDLAPFVNDQTVAVGRINLGQLDIAAACKQWLEPLAVADDEQKILHVVVEEFDGWSRRLKADGVTHFYVVASIQFIPNPELLRRGPGFAVGAIANTIFAVVPGASPTTIDEFHRLLQTKGKEAWPGGNAAMLPDCRQIRGAAVVGMGTLLDGMAKTSAPTRSEDEGAAAKERQKLFETAFTAAESQPLCLAVVPPPIFARAAEEILRDPLPGSKNKPAGPILARGLRWLAFGVEPNLDKFNARLVIQSDNLEAAGALADVMKTSLADLVNRGPGGLTLLSAAQLFSLLPEPKADQLVLSIDGQRAALFQAFAKQAIGLAAASTARHQAANKLHAIGIAMLNFEDKLHQYPDRAIRDKNGKPLLSWRVAILPELEEMDLYRQFHLDEPWDSFHNRQLIEKMPDIYRSQDSPPALAGRTRFLVPVGESTSFPPDRGTALKEFTDGVSKTILVVEADPDHAVIWTKPDDLEVDLDNPLRGLTAGKDLFQAVFGDAHVETLSASMKPKALRAMFTRNAGDTPDDANQ
jgi:hypothetical protein